MKGSIHRSACAVLALIALSLTGTMTQCGGWKSLVVEIPDFESSQVAGLELWRGDEEASPSVSQVGRIVFGDLLLQNGSEVLEYTMLDSESLPLEAWDHAAIVRGEDPDAVTLHFIFSAWSEAPGWVRVSSFNAVGESDLSEDAVFL